MDSQVTAGIRLQIARTGFPRLTRMAKRVPGNVTAAFRPPKELGTPRLLHLAVSGQPRSAVFWLSRDVLATKEMMCHGLPAHGASADPEDARRSGGLVSKILQHRVEAR
jgi:hypothetical protein